MPFIFIEKKLHMVNMSDAIRRNRKKSSAPKENEKKTIAPIGDWKCNFPPFLGNYYRPTDRLADEPQANQSTNHLAGRPTDGHEVSWESYTSNDWKCIYTYYVVGILF